MYKLNNKLIFNEKPMGLKEFLIRMVEVLGITIYRCLEGRAGKMES